MNIIVAGQKTQPTTTVKLQSVIITNIFDDQRRFKVLLVCFSNCWYPFSKYNFLLLILCLVISLILFFCWKVFTFSCKDLFFRVMFVLPKYCKQLKS